MIHVTKEFHWVGPKQFLGLWYVRRKPCNYLASILALSANGPNRASNCASSSRSTIRCVKNDIWAYSTFGINHAPILHRHKQYLQTDRNKIPHDPCHKEYHRVRPKWFVSLWYVWRKLCTYLAPILTLSPNGPKWDTTRPTSPRSTIGCIQNNFRAYGIFSANQATILCQD
jgi:hypothetical protein